MWLSALIAGDNDQSQPGDGATDEGCPHQLDQAGTRRQVLALATHTPSLQTPLTPFMTRAAVFDAVSDTIIEAELPWSMVAVFIKGTARYPRQAVYYA